MISACLFRPFDANVTWRMSPTARYVPKIRLPTGSVVEMYLSNIFYSLTQIASDHYLSIFRNVKWRCRAIRYLYERYYLPHRVTEADLPRYKGGKSASESVMFCISDVLCMM